ncbi:DegT/DnrJ/EryC1/StrS family aminotransferase [Methanoplanus sp. FWC-SCC4]|uniref:DegT/DnrJ/EryC1/StrS family aminotransferase n=1 Tax=Methanochimaera problematica TaxID=2609417 RepID=A0AA97FDC3_9EURY|nr:DegT/DnrJ/EryC1/StrS family aminotransferase [Methanoplanus sp. FWC-SCC4]WOF15381.1 DegT/DnrJ/EryC1/StrS family aminotransferase [Methanoplanus sp. FWC-SCC4]
MIPIARPYIGEEEIAAVSDVMRLGVLANGSVVTEFEKRFAKYCGCKYAVGTNSGTSALHAALLCTGIKPGDEVIVPSFTFIATATSVSMCGAKPVIVDVEDEYFTIDPDRILENITDKTKAVIGVHLFGQPFDLRAVLEICEDKNIFLIEDCAQAHGSLYQGQKVGSFGLSGCFSFYPTKNMTTGEGGIVTTSESSYDERLRRVVNHGQSEKYLHTELGFNLRMSNIDAAIGNVQLSKLDWMNERRCENANILSKGIDAEGIKKPVIRPGCSHVYHQYVICLEEDYKLSRDELMQKLNEKGIGCAVHYPMPVHKQPLYLSSGNYRYECPVSERLSESVLSLPVHPGVTTEDCEYICKVINGAD